MWALFQTDCGIGSGQIWTSIKTEFGVFFGKFWVLIIGSELGLEWLMDRFGFGLILGLV